MWKKVRLAIEIIITIGTIILSVEKLLKLLTPVPERQNLQIDS